MRTPPLCCPRPDIVKIQLHKKTRIHITYHLTLKVILTILVVFVINWVNCSGNNGGSVVYNWGSRGQLGLQADHPAPGQVDHPRVRWRPDQLLLLLPAMDEEHGVAFSGGLQLARENWILLPIFRLHVVCSNTHARLGTSRSQNESCLYYGPRNYSRPLAG